MGYEISLVLKYTELSRSTYYYHLAKGDIPKQTGGGRPIPGYSFDIYHRPICDEQIKEWICSLIDSEVSEAYGYIKITYALKEYLNLIINKKKVYRLCKELDILLPQREVKPKYPRHVASNRLITDSNQLWEADIKYAYIAGEKRFLFLMCILDVADRNVVDYHIGLRCTGQDVGITLKTAMMRRQLYNSATKPVIRTDNGPQFISDYFEKTCLDLKIEHERIPVKTPNKNAHIESFNRILEYECFKKHDFENYFEAYETVVEFIKNYNNIRIHSSTGYMPPKKFYNLLQTGQKLIEMKV